MLKLNLLIVLVIFCLTVQAQQARDFKYGHYYTSNGQKMEGFLFVPSSLNSIVFKKDNETEKQTIALDKIQSVVLSGGRDSLVVKTENNKANKHYLGSIAALTPTSKFYRKFNIYTTAGSGSASMSAAPTMHASGGRPIFSNTNSFSNSGGKTSIDETFMYEEGNTTYELTKKNYIDVLSKAFADNQVLTKQFQSKYLGFDDLAMIFQKYNEDKKSN